MVPTSPVRGPVGAYARDHRYQRVPSDTAVELWLGISTDEAIPRDGGLRWTQETGQAAKRESCS